MAKKRKSKSKLQKSELRQAKRNARLRRQEKFEFKAHKKLADVDGRARRAIQRFKEHLDVLSDSMYQKLIDALKPYFPNTGDPEDMTLAEFVDVLNSVVDEKKSVVDTFQSIDYSKVMTF